MSSSGRILVSWHQARLAILVTLFGSVVAVFIKTCLPSEDTATAPKTVRLPATIPIEGWQFVGSQPLTDQRPDQPNYQAGQTYHYQQQDKSLYIEARYIDGTNGDVEGFIKLYTPLNIPSPNLKIETHHQENVGSYLILFDQDKIHLSSCINPHGGSTVSIEAYKWNRNFQDIRYRFMPWLLGKNLKDERCLWTHASLSMENNQVEAATSLIEAAWISWYHAWAIYLLQMPPVE